MTVDLVSREDAIRLLPSLTEELRRVSGDVRLSIIEVRTGSVVLVLDIDESAAEAISRLIRNGDLRDFGGYPIVDFRRDFSDDLTTSLPSIISNNSTEESPPPMSDTIYNVFLCHNSKDKPIVRKLRDALKARGLRTWFDDDQLIPGRPWLEALEKAIESIGAAAVCVGPSDFGPWQNREMRAYIERFVRNKAAVIPVLLPGATETPKLPVFLSPFTWVDLRDGLSEDGLHRLTCGIRGTAPGETPPVDRAFLPPTVGDHQNSSDEQTDSLATDASSNGQQEDQSFVGADAEVVKLPDEVDPDKLLPRVVRFLRDLPTTRPEIYEEIETALYEEMPEQKERKRENERIDLMEVVWDESVNSVLEALYRWLDRPARPRISVDGWQEVLTHLVVLAAARPDWLHKAREQEMNGGLVSVAKGLQPLSAAVLISSLFDVAIRLEGRTPMGYISVGRGRGSKGHAVEDRFQEFKTYLQKEYSKYLSPETETLDDDDIKQMLRSDRGQNNPRFVCLPGNDALARTISDRLDGLVTVLQEKDKGPSVLDQSLRLVKNVRDLLDKLQPAP